MTNRDKYLFFIIIALLASVYAFLFSSSGLLERIKLVKERTLLENQLVELRGERDRLEGELRLVKEGASFMNDAAALSLVKPGEKIILFGDKSVEPAVRRNLPPPKESFWNHLSGLRIIWVVISIIIIALYMIIIMKKNDKLEVSAQNTDRFGY